LKTLKDQVIFFFDEFHALFKLDGLQASTKGEDIKMFFEDFKFIIGATTKTEFDEFVKKQPAIADRRFIVIDVADLLDEKIKIILRQYLQKTCPAIIPEKNALDHLIKQASAFNPNTSKIDAAMSFIKKSD
jgi:ATP-dependent Clp protease ATP-binding subunit ClpA